MSDAPTHTHVDVPKCSSYNGRHEYKISGLSNGINLDQQLLTLELLCIYCEFPARAYYKLIEIIEGE